MFLTVSTTHRPATDLGYLLHKHPERVQSLSVPFGTAHVLYPEATRERCTVALVLEVDPVGLGAPRPRVAELLNHLYGGCCQGGDRPPAVPHRASALGPDESVDSWAD